MAATRPAGERRRVGLYLVGGVLSALVDIGVLQALLVAGVGPLAATSAGFGASLVVNYLFHANVTFTGPAARGGAFARYLAVVAGNYLLTLALVAGAAALFGMPMAGKLVALPLVAAVGYLLGKRWIFT
jgi:putative flippase GtrA